MQSSKTTWGTDDWLRSPQAFRMRLEILGAQYILLRHKYKQAYNIMLRSPL